MFFIHQQGFNMTARSTIKKCLLCAVLMASSVAQAAGDKVVYHIDNAAQQATKGLRNVRNHLDIAPDTQIIVVTHADGVDFLLEGAKDKANPNIDYASLVSALKSRNVRFEVCEITLKNRGIDKNKFILDADFTPSGVVRAARLQVREGYGYIKP
jgi:intracellular sulfur oxidation DsrE/DsrF family protein